MRLLETTKRYNEACNFVASTALILKLRKKYKLHREAYRVLRECFGLGSQLAIRIILRVVESNTSQGIQHKVIMFVWIAEC